MTDQTNQELILLKPIYKTYEDFPIEDLLLYAGIDCVVTSNLASKLSPTIHREPPYTYVEMVGGVKKKRLGTAMSIMDSYQEYTSTALEFILDLEINGFKYDVELHAVTKARIENELARLEEQIFVGIGRTINLDSPKILSEFLYVEKGYEVKSKTKTGEPSTDGDAIKETAKDHPEDSWLTLLAKRNDLSSIYNTFIATYIEDFVKADGRVHPRYNLHGTGSFRISGEEPNLTQLPRPKHGYNLRQFFTVEDGYCFIAADYSSAEVKILGAISKDPNLLKAIADGLDFHSYSASEMYGISYDEFVDVLGDENHSLYRTYKSYRQNSKALTFSLLYGSSIPGIARAMGVSEEEAQRLMDLYFDNFPGIKEYVELTHDMARLNGYVIGEFGQRKMTYGIYDCFRGTAVYNGALRLSQNVRIQNTTSSFGLENFAKLNNEIN